MLEKRGSRREEKDRAALPPFAFGLPLLVSKQKAARGQNVCASSSEIKTAEFILHNTSTALVRTQSLRTHQPGNTNCEFRDSTYEVSSMYIENCHCRV